VTIKPLNQKQHSNRFVLLQFKRFIFVYNRLKNIAKKNSMDSEELILAFNLYLKLPFVKMNIKTL
jgi:hypothetical protein